MMAGFLLAVVTYFPIFQGLTHFANPALEKALTSSPVTVAADPAECSFQLKLTGTESYTGPVRRREVGAGRPLGELRQRGGGLPARR